MINDRPRSLPQNSLPAPTALPPMRLPAPTLRTLSGGGGAGETPPVDIPSPLNQLRVYAGGPRSQRFRQAAVELPPRQHRAALSRAHRLATKQLAEARTAARLRGPADPRPAKGDKGQVDKRRFQGRLFVRGVSADDVDQGQLGDCYFASAVSAVAAKRPEVIRRAIRDNRDGTYSVRLFHKGKPVRVRVDADLYTNKGGKDPRYGRSTDRGELWFPILEKAYAKLHGGYDVIGKGGKSRDVIRALTGEAGSITKNKKRSADQLFRQIDGAMRKRRPVTVGTFDAHADYASKGISPDHSYAVLGAYGRGAERYVVLRNPWGHGELKNVGYDTDQAAHGTSGNDGTFRVRLDDFQRLFSHTTVG